MKLTMPFWITPEGQQNQNNMKIKVTQMDQATRSTIALALVEYSMVVKETFPLQSKKYNDMAQAVRHGELLLCEYVYPEQEKGGEHGV